MDDNVHEPPPPANPAAGSGGNGNNLHARVSAIEARLDYIATKADVQEIKIWALRGTLAGIVAATLIAIAILKLFD